MRGAPATPSAGALPRLVACGAMVEIMAAVLAVLLASLLGAMAWVVKALIDVRVKLAEIDRDLKAGTLRFDDHERRLTALEDR